MKQSKGSPSFARTSQTLANVASSSVPAKSTLQNDVPLPQLASDVGKPTIASIAAQLGGVTSHGVPRKSQKTPGFVSPAQPACV